MRYLVPGFVVLLSALLFSTVALARGHGPHDQQMMNFGQNQFQQGQLLQGPEQWQALEETSAIHHKAVATLTAKLHTKQKELDALLSDSTSSQRDIDRVVGKINELNSALFKEQVAMRMKLRKQGVSHDSLGIMGGMMQEQGLDLTPFCGSGTTGPDWNPGL